MKIDCEICGRNTEHKIIIVGDKKMENIEIFWMYDPEAHVYTHIVLEKNAIYVNGAIQK